MNTTSSKHDRRAATPPPTETSAAERIKEELFRRNVPNLRRLDVEVSKGVAHIRGNVGSFYEKQLATICCQKASGVNRVLNSIRVVATRR